MTPVDGTTRLRRFLCNRMGRSLEERYVQERSLVCECLQLGQLLSAITVQALADLGWVVDVTQADLSKAPPFGSAAKASAKIEAPTTHAHGEQREPIYVVDQQGRIVRTLGD